MLRNENESNASFTLASVASTTRAESPFSAPMAPIGLVAAPYRGLVLTSAPGVVSSALVNSLSSSAIDLSSGVTASVLRLNILATKSRNSLTNLSRRVITDLSVVPSTLTTVSTYGTRSSAFKKLSFVSPLVTNSYTLDIP